MTIKVILIFWFCGLFFSGGVSLVSDFLPDKVLASFCKLFYEFSAKQRANKLGWKSSPEFEFCSFQV